MAENGVGEGTEDQEELGRFGRKHLAFLREFHPTALEELEKSGDLDEYLFLLDNEAENEYWRLFKQETACVQGNDNFLEREAAYRYAGVMANSEVMRNFVLVSPES